MTDSTSDLDAVAGRLAAELAELEKTPEDVARFPGWLSRWSILRCEVQTLWAEHLIATLKDSNDKHNQVKYKRLMEFWIPQFENYDKKMGNLLLKSKFSGIRPDISSWLDTKTDKHTSEELNKLIGEEYLLRGRYSSLTANRSIDFRGQEFQLPEARSQLALIEDRHERTCLWLAIKQADLAIAPDLDLLYDELVQTRQQLAKLANIRHYADYIWTSNSRTYSFDDAIELLDNITDVFADLTNWADRNRAQQLSIDILQPWDLQIRLSSKSAKKLDQQEYLNLAKLVFAKIDPEFNSLIQQLYSEGRFDLFPRRGKVEGSWTTFLYALGTSNIMCNLNGSIEDISVLMHEIGHSIHNSHLSRNTNNLAWDLQTSMDVCEFFAFSLQFLASQYLLQDPEIDNGSKSVYKRRLLEDIISGFRTVGERLRLEGWLYQHSEKVTIEEVDNQYIALYTRSGVDWTSHEDYLRKQWQKPHLFVFSFYNIEYAVALVAALLFARNYQLKPEESLTRLKKAMGQGATTGTSSIFESAGIQFPFTSEQVVLAKNYLSEWLL